ncbi:unnamed protein product, partial [Discosporangium mesarthrocarpum]
MLSTLLEYRYEVMSTNEATNQRPKGPSINIQGADWDNAEEMCKMLGPFAEAVELIEGDKYITLSYIPCLMEGLNVAILDASSSLPEDGAFLHAGDDLFDDHSHRWEELNTPMKEAAMLDPRTKDGAWMETAEHNAYFELVKHACKDLVQRDYAVEQAQAATAQASQSPTVSAESSRAIPKKKRKHELPLGPMNTARDRAGSGPGQGGGSAAARASTEIARFRATLDLVLDASGDDVLAWWAKHQHGFPYLERPAVVHLAIPATSATSEWVFSAAGNTVTKKSNRLGSEIVDALVVLH